MQFIFYFPFKITSLLKNTIKILDDLKLLLACDVVGVLAGEADIAEAIRKYYGIGAETVEKIIDKSDRVLAKHYGFTDEELDFIINYDIKYRMGIES